MKINVKLDLNDKQLNALACLLAGKTVKAKAKRRDVQAIVDGCMAGLTRADEWESAHAGRGGSAATEAGREMGEQPPAEMLNLIPEMQRKGYVAGWQYAGRRVAEIRG